jgi:hypothetical protein
MDSEIEKLNTDDMNMGYVNSSYIIDSSGTDTITIDPSTYSTIGSITSPTTLTWTQPYDNYTITGSGFTNNTRVNINADGITMPESGDIKIGDKSLKETLSSIQDRLAILSPNPELEERWEQLKELRRQYVELERDFLEKEKIMKILKEQ